MSFWTFLVALLSCGDAAYKGPARLNVFTRRPAITKTKPSITTKPAREARRAALLDQLERQRRAVASTEASLRVLEEMEQPSGTDTGEVGCSYAAGYLSKTAGCYSTVDGTTVPPPSAMTLALENFQRELPEMVAAILGHRKSEARAQAAASGYFDALQNLTLSNDAIWDREAARPEVPAPLVIKLPYLALCGVLDNLFDGRPIARFWLLETVARVPYFGYNTMIFLYETLGWWRRSAKLKRVHFNEEWNEFHHLLIMEALGGDQAWFDRFIGQHSALVYFGIMALLWLISPTLAYNFSELIEAHAVDTYAEFLDANEAALKELPPPAIALAYYEAGGEQREAGSDAASAGGGSASITSLYDVFERIRDDEASHVDSMKKCQEPDIRARARIVELGAILTAATIVATSVVTVETVEEVSAPLVAAAAQQVEEEIGEEVQVAEKSFAKAMLDAETGGNKWQPRTWPRP